ncbi:integrating conjugative element protein [Thiosulfatimonas sediminis]|uniref:Integrating conjugative element protein n=1 Tax=Thiosulfatimonas sediminis TaxID=2675054 RepID=A0A6F8PVZ5_9GAMM|nr:TraU family protein [Thiosulfatimonas sediminis]BBP46322.1 integrating conjugative element protein [Thiosulfatimonas sediminis]
MRKYVAAMLISLVPFHAAKSEDFNMLNVIQSALNLECMDYCFTGTCFHLKCSLFSGCKTWVSPKVKHNLPDLLVTVYDELDEQPFTEYRAIQSNLLSMLDDGEGANLMQGNKLESSQIRFKNTSVIGHPFLVFATNFQKTGSLEIPKTDGTYINVPGGWSFEDETGDGDHRWSYTPPSQEGGGLFVDSEVGQAFGAALGNEYFKGFCPSNVTPLKPHYDSFVDQLEWRYGFIERFQAIAKGYHWFGKREIGTRTSTNIIGTNTWGQVWPRIGFVVQQEDAKAAAIIAQRAIDIATRSDGWRIHSKAPTPASNEKTDKWQMISPKEDSVCKPFGSTNANWSDGRNDDGEEQYGWNYWRPYSCCLGGGNVIAKASIPPICLKDLF